MLRTPSGCGVVDLVAGIFFCTVSFRAIIGRGAGLWPETIGFGPPVLNLAQAGCFIFHPESLVDRVHRLF